MTILELLVALRFGARVAEDEADDLENYFVETDQWNRIFTGEIDVIYGAKGSGKSAIYALINRRGDELFDRGILLAPAENPRGATVFSDLVADPPPDERTFMALWKLYFVSLVANQLRDFDLANSDHRALIDVLEDAGLLPRRPTLSSLLRAVRSYINDWINRDVDTIEHAISYDPSTNIPIVTRKVKYHEKSDESDVISIPLDDLLKTADDILESSKFNLWIVLDRLDVAFVESPELERNGLRALFRVYNDMRALDHISLKIFVRNDIWRRITVEGFTEASHIIRTIDIKWNHNSLLNLVIRRLLNNPSFVDHYELEASKILDHFDEQERLLERVFPGQIDTGRNPKTFGWMIARTQDASGTSAPREIIHLLDAAREAQISRMNRGEGGPEGELLLERAVFKEALRVVSQTRYDQTLLAEYPEMRIYIEALRGAKAEQSPESLAKLWDTETQQAKDIAKQLHEIGFFEIRGTREQPTYWIPFLYRDALDLVQGRAD
ncbi:MAG: hypothetical protein GY789_11170 [Hyphomicrobiales bacterium]|nr:hypothetical protein [Hyphomicrobiales bacterium]